MLNAVLSRAVCNVLSDHTQQQVKIHSSQPVSGGCINSTLSITTSIGNYFVKFNSASAYPQMFEREAEGLQLLASAAAIPAPQVVGLGEGGDQSFLILELIDPAARSKDFWEEFGRSMASLHQHSSDRFGLDHDNYIGSLPQYNAWHHRWTDFFIEQRLQKQVERAYDNGMIESKHLNSFDRLYQGMDAIFPDEPPALLHGDLWSGNFMVNENGQACIIDPAVYYGHREAELAFTQLFGGFDRGFYQAYHEVYPLQPGFQQRKDLYDLYPLMVHVNLFGGGYLASVESILRAYA